MLPVWGGTPLTDIRKLQRLVNKTARYVLNKGRRWKTNDLMSELNWMRVDEMVIYHSMITLWKILKNQTPRQLAQKFRVDENWKLGTTIPRLKTTSRAFRWRSVISWNRLPLEIRQIVLISKFKTTLKSWILERRIEGNLHGDTDGDLNDGEQNDGDLAGLYRAVLDEDGGALPRTDEVDDDRMM